MDLTQLIKGRRSVHLFEDRPVAPELITELLDTAVWAPNHKMTQPWRFILVYGDGRERIAGIGGALAARRESDPARRQEFAARFRDKMMKVPAYVVVVMQEDPQISVREEDYAAVSCVIHNFSLLAWEREIGMVWESYAFMHSQPFREALGIMPGEKAVGSLHVGYPAKIPVAQPRIPAAERLTVFSEKAPVEAAPGAVPDTISGTL